MEMLSSAGDAMGLNRRKAGDQCFSPQNGKIIMSENFRLRNMVHVFEPFEEKLTSPHFPYRHIFCKTVSRYAGCKKWHIPGRTCIRSKIDWLYLSRPLSYQCLRSKVCKRHHCNTTMIGNRCAHALEKRPFGALHPERRFYFLIMTSKW